MVVKFIIYTGLFLLVGCKKTPEYSILYPKKLTTRDSPESLEKKFVLFNHPDNPKHDGFDYYVYKDSIFGKTHANLFVGFKRGALCIVNVKYYGDEEGLMLLRNYYDSSLSGELDKERTNKIFSRTDLQITDTAKIFDKIIDGKIGYYSFEINE